MTVELERKKKAVLADPPNATLASVFDSPTVASLAATTLVAYLLGALPTAYIASRLRGVDIFRVGTGQAGATNVWRQVSRRIGLTVFFFDVAKGLAAITVAGWLGLTGAWALWAACAVVLGHCHSVFTGFKGGDGVSTWGGIIVGMAPVIAIPPVILVGIVRWRLGARLSHPTYWGGAAGIAAFLGCSFLPIIGMGVAEACGLAGVGIAVLAHSMAYHRRVKSQPAITPLIPEYEPSRGEAVPPF